jgi:hypothetical protein
LHQPTRAALVGRASREIPRVFFPKLHVGSHVPTAHQFPRAAPGPRSAPYFERPCHGHRSRCSRVPTRHDFSRLFFRRGSHALSKARITSNIPAVIDVGARPKLFDKRGRSMLGHDGVSQYFMVGVAEIRNPAAVGRRLGALRRDLMSDPYFAGACSMHLGRRKTALAFHAKDDLPEVRWRVYERLRRLDIKVAVVLRRKGVLEAQARAMFQTQRRCAHACHRACVRGTIMHGAVRSGIGPAVRGGWIASDRLLLVGRAKAIRAYRKPVLRRNCETDRIRLGLGRGECCPSRRLGSRRASNTPREADVHRRDRQHKHATIEGLRASTNKMDRLV